MLIQSLWKPLRTNFNAVVSLLREKVRLADAEFHLNAVRNQQDEEHKQSLERSKQEEDRQKADESRNLLVTETRTAETERRLHAEEHIKTEAERAIMNQQREIENNERRDRTRHKIMKWLSRSETVNPYPNALAKHLENPSSCRWIFETVEY